MAFQRHPWIPVVFFTLLHHQFVQPFVVTRHYHPGQWADRFWLPLFAVEGPKGETAGPRSESSRSRSRRRTTSSRPNRQRRSPSSSAKPIKRAPHQFDHTKEKARPFVDTLTEIQNQVSNEGAPTFSLKDNSSDDDEETSASIKIEHEHVESRSLDDLFPNLDFSEKFSTSAEFRNSLRNSMREDIFNTTPTYANLSEKARRVLLLPDSSLQGSWRCDGGTWIGSDDNDDTSKIVRMKSLTNVLKEYLGPKAPTGDEFMDTIGSLCGSSPQTHWIDIVGVIDRKIPHSWHQDTGRSPNGDTKTVLMGFPPEDNYDGVGVFSHVVKLENEQWASDDHPPNVPVLFADGDIDDTYIIRPRFSKGHEIILYRDVDVLHSAPDVAYRTSVMRFM